MACIYVRNRIYWGRYTDRDGVERRRSTEVTDKRAADQILARWIRDEEYAKAGLLPIMPEERDKPLAQHIDEWVDSRIARRSAEGRRAYVVKAETFLNGAATRMKWGKLGDINERSIEKLFAMLASEPNRRGMLNSPKTLHNYRGYLSSFLTWCVKKKRCVDNPCKVEMTQDISPREERRALTPIELRKLLQCNEIPQKRRLTYAVMVALGIRCQPTANITREMIQLDRPAGAVLDLPALAYRTADRKVYLRPQAGATVVRMVKSGRPMRIALADGVVEILRWLADGAGPNEPIMYRNLETRVLVADLEKAGIERFDEMGRRVVLHSLRHTANSAAAAGGVDVETRMAMFGWTERRFAQNVYLDQAHLPTRAGAATLGAFVTGLVPANMMTPMKNPPTLGGNSGECGREDLNLCGIAANAENDVASAGPVPVLVPFSRADQVLSALLTGRYIAYVRGGAFVLMEIGSGEGKWSSDEQDSNQASHEALPVVRTAPHATDD